MATYAKRKLKYSRNKNFNLLHYVEWDRIVALAGAKADWMLRYQGRIQDFKLGGGALKKIAPSGGRREHFRGISCEKSRFYAKKSYFFQLPREARNFLRYFVWKITILRQKIIFFPILGGARAGCSPLNSMYESSVSVTVLNSREKIPYEVLLACNASRVWCGKRGEG
jgi:hypothetical protein